MHSQVIFVSADDPATLASSESVVIDGANGVTRAPRLKFPQADVAVGVAVVIALVAVVTRRMKHQRIVLGALAIAASIPGAIHVLAYRADAPLRRPELTRTIESTLAQITASAPWPQPVKVVHENDDVLFPLGRYAVPTRARSGLELELRGTSLNATCAPAGEHVVCGREAP